MIRWESKCILLSSAELNWKLDGYPDLCSGLTRFWCRSCLQRTALLFVSSTSRTPNIAIHRVRLSNEYTLGRRSFLWSLLSPCSHPDVNLGQQTFVQNFFRLDVQGIRRRGSYDPWCGFAAFMIYDVGLPVLWSMMWTRFYDLWFRCGRTDSTTHDLSCGLADSTIYTQILQATRWP